MVATRLARAASPAARTYNVGSRAPDLRVLSQRLHVPSLLLLVLLLAAWAELATLVRPYVLPSPPRVAASFADILHSGILWSQVGASLWRISLGFLIALALALAIAALTVWQPPLRQVAHDLATMLNAVSVFVWLVLAIVWFGISDTGPVFITTLIVLPMLLQAILVGIDSIPPDLIDVARIYCHSDRERFTRAILPSVLPSLVTGMKVSYAEALRVSVVAELFGVKSGVGYMMNLGRDTLRTDLVFVWAFILIAMMLVVDKALFSLLLRRVEAWR